jgi:type VI secretion system protein ImpA
LFPPTDDDDLEPLAAPLDWLNARLEVPLKSIALNSAGHSWYRFKESRALGYEESVKDPNQKKNREKALKEGKLPPEEFDRAFTATAKAFYVATEKSLDRTLAAITQLDAVCTELLKEVAPSFAKLSSSVEEVRHVVHQLLEKKREVEPDPPEAPPVTTIESEMEAVATEPEATQHASGVLKVSLNGTSEPVERRDAIEAVAAAAALLRKRNPSSPAPYLMLRGLRWGELRSASVLGDATMLEAPPTEVRCQIKSLALEGRWVELLETAETLMAFPYSRAWLDLQRFVVESCVALGPSFDAIARAIRSELRTLLRDIPELLDATLMDETPVANPETRSWLHDLISESQEPAPVLTRNMEFQTSDSFRKKFVDPYLVAMSAMATGDHQKAFEIMREEIARQRSGRGRFFRRLQLVQLCISAQKETIAQPILEDLLAAADAHKIEDWEDRETVAEALAIMMSSSKRIQSDAKEKQKYFERICRLDPVKALATAV